MASPIERSPGTTASERYLAQLADRTFLNLWSYPNLYFDKKLRGKGDGRELCDLLVICGDDVLIFSDKENSWPGGADIDVAWKRWFKRAVLRSFGQVRGAERWIDQFPGQIFLDRQCTEHLPLRIPPKERRRVHGIVVAHGAGQACMDYFGGGSGSLMVVSGLTGSDHIDPKAPHYSPFAIGDLDPRGSFVHVLDDTTLEIMMRELDTVTDFTSYLRKKEEFIRSGHFINAHGEEDLLAHYLTLLNPLGEHDFVKGDGTSWEAHDRTAFGPGIYQDFVNNPQYHAKKDADRVSYTWDSLIEVFSNHMLAGTTLIRDGTKFDLAEQEEAIRHMALVPRYQRRLFSLGIRDALEQSQDHDRFVRGFLPGPTERHRETGFFLMALKASKWLRLGGYDEYREVRQRMLYGYALSFLKKHPQLERIIGIAVEPPSELGTPKGSSEDLMMVEMPEWDQRQLNQLAEYEKVLSIMKEGRFSEYGVSDKEYPDVVHKARMTDGERRKTPITPGLNRKQRRALAAKTRRAEE